MIELYTYGTGNGRRASVMLEECGLPYNVHKVDLAKGEQKAPWYLKLNPAGAIPVIVDPEGPGGKPITLAQSGAICLYLAEKTGKFLPKDPARRALAYQWLMHTMSDEAPTSGAINQLTSFVPDKSSSTMAYFENRLVNFFRYANSRLGEAEYLAGELSVADFALYTVVAGRKEMIEKLTGLDNLKRWTATMGARAGVAKGMKVPA